MRNSRFETYRRPAFLICAAVLAVAAGSMSIAVRSLGVHFRKDFLPPKKPLSIMDEKSLVPYEVVSKGQIDDEYVLKELGTEDYIQWTLRDPCVAPDDPTHLCSLFVTYYGLPDRVPHVPDECYMGVGFQRLAAEDVSFTIDRDGREQKLAGRYVVFAGTQSGQWRNGAKFAVLYLFNVNGVYAGSREKARFTLNKNIRGKYSYFSKVEWKFVGTKFGQPANPGKEEQVTASEKLLAAVLPVLEEGHWPEWPVVSSKLSSTGGHGK